MVGTTELGDAVLTFGDEVDELLVLNDDRPAATADWMFREGIDRAALDGIAHLAVEQADIAEAAGYDHAGVLHNLLLTGFEIGWVAHRDAAAKETDDIYLD
jgi:hypothetical protein